MTGLAALTAFRSDGRRLATTGANGDLKVWDTTDPRQPALLIRLTRRHRMVAATWNPTAADLLATMATNRTISIWRMVDDRPPQEMLRLDMPYGRYGALAWHADGRHIVCASPDGVISAWDVVSGSRQTQVLGDSSVCLSLFSPPDGALRATYRDGSIREAGRRTRHIRPITAAAWSVNGAMLAVARDDGSVEARDESLRTRWSQELNPAGPLLLAWHGDAVMVAADCALRSLIAIDVSGRPLWRTQVPIAPTALSVAGGVVAVGGHSYAPWIVELGAGTTLSTSPG